MTFVHLLAVLTACAPAGPPAASPDLVLTDANNYAFDGALRLPSTPVATASDLTLDWRAATTDLECHPLDPAADVDLVSVLHLRDLTPDEVAAAIADDTLAMSDVTAFGTWTNDAAETAVPLSALQLLGQPAHFEAQLTEGSGAWLLGLARGTTPGVGMAVLGFLDPQDASTTTTVDIAGGCGQLEAAADLHDLAPVPAPLRGPYTLDWSAVTTDARGLPFTSSDVDSVMLARYDHAPIADLEAGFLDLEQQHDGLWSQPVADTTAASLDALVDAEGAAFPGLDTDATWILALRCGRCANPAPPVLTVLTPR